ncbi:MAG: thiolase family protein [Desulfobacterales bacterium]
MREVVVLGAGLHRYGLFPETSIAELGAEAVRGALADANITWENIETAYCGTTQPGWSVGHQVCQTLGFTGLGIMNIENASASGSSAFREAYLSVLSGEHDVALAFGVDKTKPPKLSPSGRNKDEKTAKAGDKHFTSPVEIFAAITRQHMDAYGTTIDQLARVAVKNRHNAALNPHAQFQSPVTIEEVHQSRMIAEPVTKLHCCPWGDGAAAVIVCEKKQAEKYTDKVCPRVAASVLKSTIPDEDPMFSLTRLCAHIAYEQAGADPEDLDLIELHDAFTIEEIIYAEALGLCPRGEGGRLVETGETALTGNHVINSSGGLLSMGHPLGPTGVGQIAEILWQMRGECHKRQIRKPVNLAMAHMVGAGGVCAIHLLKK